MKWFLKNHFSDKIKNKIKTKLISPKTENTINFVNNILVNKS